MMDWSGVLLTVIFSVLGFVLGYQRGRQRACRGQRDSIPTIWGDVPRRSSVRHDPGERA